MTKPSSLAILARMHEQEYAIIRALVPVAWADGKFAEQEMECIKAFLDAYNASDEERKAVLEYAKEKRTIDDISLQELSADDRRILLITSSRRDNIVVGVVRPTEPKPSPPGSQRLD